MTDTTKKCARCGQVKELSEFYPRNERGKWEGRCRSCCSERHKAWYAQNKAAGRRSPMGRKRCWRCKRTRTCSAFGISRSHADGLNPQCKECARRYAKRTGNPARSTRDPHGRIAQLFHGYRLRPEQYLAMLQEQGNACAICREVFTRTPHVDHCHKTGRVRGLLCGRCNVFLGALDRDGFLEAAMEYLKQVTGG